MTKKTIFLSLIISIWGYVIFAEDSPFDVLGGEDRYKSEAAEEFDVNEGEEPTPDVPDPRSISNVFDVMQDAPEHTGTYYNIAKIVALNKITAKSQEFTIEVGNTAYFGNIAISVQKCYSNNDLYLPTSKIFVSVVENRVDEDPQNIFKGWLISGNIPASVVEHPSYELIAIGCSNAKK